MILPRFFRSTIIKNNSVKKYLSTLWSFQHNINSEINNCYNNYSLCLHSFARLNAKIFVDKENQYAHNILEKSSLYNIFSEPDLINSDTDTSVVTNIDSILFPNDSAANNEILENFKKLALYCKNTGTCITDEKFDKFIDLLTKKCNQFNDEQLIQCFKYMWLLPVTHGIRVRNFLELWSSLDSVCCDRVEKWTIDELLLISDYWYGLNLAGACEFLWLALKKLGRRVRQLNPQQLVHTMFLCNIARKPLLDMYEFEKKFITYINNLSLKEIGIMSMGFFKTKTPLRSEELINEIYRRLMQEFQTVEDITLVNILKILRYSSRLPQAKIMKELLDKICPQIERLTLLSCLHVSLLGTDIPQCHYKSLELIIDRFNKDIDLVRIKDMERISFVLSLYDFQTSKGSENEVCEKILLKIKDRTDEIIRYPKCFPTCLHYLSIRGYYDQELISNALDEKFIKHAYGPNALLGREIFCLDSFVRINLKDKYTGNLLTVKKRQTLGKLLTSYIPERNTKYRLNATDRILLEVKETCESVYHPCYFQHVLPHYQRPDIILSYDKSKNKFLPMNATTPEDYYTGVILTRNILLEKDSPDILTFVIVIGGWNHYVRDVNNKPTGLFKMKLKQLELLGHQIVTVPWFEWRQLETISDRQNYIKRKLSRFMH